MKAYLAGSNTYGYLHTQEGKPYTSLVQWDGKGYWAKHWFLLVGQVAGATGTQKRPQ